MNSREIEKIVNNINTKYSHLVYDNENRKFKYLGFDLNIEEIDEKEIIEEINCILLNFIPLLKVGDIVDNIDDDSDILYHIDKDDALNYYNVEDVDECSAWKLIEELETRFLSKKEVDNIKKLVSDYEETDTTFPCENLSDVYKIEHLKNIWYKYSAEDFERLLP